MAMSQSEAMCLLMSSLDGSTGRWSKPWRCFTTACCPRETLPESSCSAGVLSTLWKRFLPMYWNFRPLWCFGNRHMCSEVSKRMRPKLEYSGA